MLENSDVVSEVMAIRVSFTPPSSLSGASFKYYCMQMRMRSTNVKDVVPNGKALASQVCRTDLVL